MRPICISRMLVLFYIQFQRKVGGLDAVAQLRRLCSTQGLIRANPVWSDGSRLRPFGLAFLAF